MIFWKKHYRFIVEHPVTIAGVKNFINYYIRVSVSDTDTTEANWRSKMMNTILKKIYEITNTNNEDDASKYASRLSEILKVIMLRRTKASLGIDFGAKARAGKMFDVTLPNGEYL